MSINGSYTSASTRPVKLYSCGITDQIIPVHAQLNPTNRCNRQCSFCSCANRDTSLELSLENMQDILVRLSLLGCRAITITGGGEPLMYPHLNALIRLSIAMGIKVGLVTNGDLLRVEQANMLDKLTWCRISCCTEYNVNFDRLSKTIDVTPNVDWAFSYVLDDHHNPDILKQCVEYANEKNFTHVRVTADLLSDADYELDCDDSKIIFQQRKKYTRGTKKCLISLLKPNIGPDGKIYPCCGIQYAKNDVVLDFDDTMSMGDIDTYIERIAEQDCFDGSVCDRCYYSEYNKVLSDMLDGKTERCDDIINHKEFV